MISSTSFTRRQALGILGGGAAAFGLTACSTAVPKLASSAPPIGSLAGSTVRMNVLQAGYRPAIEPAVAAFTKKTGIKVEFIGYGSDQIQERTQLEVSSKTKTTDVFSLDGAPYVATMHTGFEPLQPLVRRDSVALDVYVPSMLEMGRFPSDYTAKDASYKMGYGELYALPVRIGPHILHYRTDLFEQFNLQPPTTMEAMAAAAKTITKGTNGKVYGVEIEGAQTIYIVLQWYDVLWSWGADVFDKTLTKCTLDTPEALKATEFFVNLYKDGYTAPSTPSIDLDAALVDLEQGKAAMYPEYSPRAQVLNKPAISSTAGKWGWTTMPGGGGHSGVGVLTGWSLALNKYSDKKDAAWELIKYLTSPEVQLVMARDNANAPTVSSVYEDTSYQKVAPSAKVTLAAAKTGKARVGIPGILEIEQTILSSELSAALIGKKSPQEALKSASTRITAVLRK